MTSHTLPDASADAGAQRMRRSQKRVLVVDDDRMSLLFIEEELRNLGYDVLPARGGEEAYDILEQDEGDFDVVVLDKVMPGMDGLTLVRRLKSHPDLAGIPVVMLTGDDSAEDMREGVDAGVFYYLAKPVESKLLTSVLSAALRDSAQKSNLQAELSDQRLGADLIDSCRFKFRTIEEANSVAAFAATCFPDPERVLPGLAELMINAVEHGNLEIGFDTKATLIRTGEWRAEIERRLGDATFRNRSVSAVFSHREDGLCIVITDEGAGFDWRQFKRIDPSRASASHGRGIARASTISFDKVAYNAKGNQVVGFISNAPEIAW